MWDIFELVSKSDSKMTTVILSRFEYFTFVLKLGLHYVFSLVCLCVEFHQASEEGGMSHSATQAHSVGGATDIHSRASTEQRPANHSAIS